MVCKRTQHVTFNDVASCSPTMLRPFARGLYELRAMLRETSVLSSVSCGLNDLLYPDFV